MGLKTSIPQKRDEKSFDFNRKSNFRAPELFENGTRKQITYTYLFTRFLEYNKAQIRGCSAKNSG